MQKRQIIKLGVELVVTAGVGIVASNAIKPYIPQESGFVKKQVAAIGGAVIVSLLTAGAVNHVNAVIDQVADIYGEAKSARDQATDENGDVDFEKMAEYMEKDVQSTETLFDLNEKTATDLDDEEEN